MAVAGKARESTGRARGTEEESQGSCRRSACPARAARCRSALLPEDAEHEADAGGNHQLLDRLLVNVLFQALLPFLCLLAALIIILAGGIAQVLVLLGGRVANRAGHVSGLVAYLAGRAGALLLTAAALSRG